MLKEITKPYIILLISVSASFMAWLMPTFGFIINGIGEKFSVFSFGFLLAVIWYFLAFFFTWIFFKIGTNLNIKSKGNSTFDLSYSNDFLFKFMAFSATIGVISSLYKISKSMGGINEIFHVISGGYAGNLKWALYKDYSPGLYTFRYLVIHATILTVYRRFFLKKKSNVDFLNIANSLIVAMIASRLSLIITFFGILILITKNYKISLKPKYVVFGLIIGFHVLSILNYSRNFHYYNENHMGFYSSGVSEITRYLSTPFQGAIAVGENYDIIRLEPENQLKYSTIDVNLMTNSCFLFMFFDHDFYAIPFMIMVVSFWGLVAGYIYNFNNFITLSYVPIFYAFTEFWRLNWFGEGIMNILIIYPIFTVMVYVIVKLIKIDATKLSNQRK